MSYYKCPEAVKRLKRTRRIKAICVAFIAAIMFIVSYFFITPNFYKQLDESEFEACEQIAKGNNIWDNLDVLDTSDEFVVSVEGKSVTVHINDRPGQVIVQLDDDNEFVITRDQETVTWIANRILMSLFFTFVVTSIAVIFIYEPY